MAIFLKHQKGFLQEGLASKWFRTQKSKLPSSHFPPICQFTQSVRLLEVGYNLEENLSNRKAKQGLEKGATGVPAGSWTQGGNPKIGQKKPKSSWIGIF